MKTKHNLALKNFIKIVFNEYCRRLFLVEKPSINLIQCFDIKLHISSIIIYKSKGLVKITFTKLDELLN